jgi:tetratricopeptide (TPR) repeat protein
MNLNQIVLIMTLCLGVQLSPLNCLAASIQEQLATKEKTLGPDNPRLIPLLDGCVQDAAASGRQADIAIFERRILAIKEKQFGKDSPKLLETMLRLAYSYQVAQGKNPEAEELWQRIVAIAKKDPATSSAKLAMYLITLADVLGKQGKFDQEQTVLQEVLQIPKKEAGVDGRTIDHMLDTMILSVMRKGDYKAAERLLKKNVTIYEHTTGPLSSQTEMSMDRLISVLKILHKYEEMAIYLQKKVAATQNFHGPRAILALQTLSQLSDCYRDDGKYAAAEEVGEKLIKTAQSNPIISPYQLSDYMDNLALTLTAEKKNAAAEKVYQQALEMVEKKLGSNDLLVSSRLTKLAKFYRFEGKIKEADAADARSSAILAEHGVHPQ